MRVCVPVSKSPYEGCSFAVSVHGDTSSSVRLFFANRQTAGGDKRAVVALDKFVINGTRRKTPSTLAFFLHAAVTSPASRRFVR